MDANGTRFHLISGKEDWQRVIISGPAGAESARYAVREDAIGLAPELPIFPRSQQSSLLAAEQRRGTASDRYGTWYWIGHDRRTLYRAPAGSRRAVVYWRQPAAQEAAAPTRNPRHAGEFIPQAPPSTPSELCGLAVTSHHYLVVGSLDPAELLIFDLHAGGAPLHLVLPPETRFAPFDMAATADGGVWILDRDNRSLWGLDRYFRLLPLAEPAATLPEAGGFRPVTADAPLPGPAVSAPMQGFALAALDPTAIDILPDGSLLVLDRPAGPGLSSRLDQIRPGAGPGATPSHVTALTFPNLSTVTSGADQRPFVVYDIAYQPDTNYLYAVDEDGNQAVAFSLVVAAGGADIQSIEPEAMYLPMHYFGARALVFGGVCGGVQAIFYDVTPKAEQDLAVRWVPLQEIDQPRYKSLTRLDTPPFDSRTRGCVWHRLFVDGCIPAESSVEVWTRAGDDLGLLANQEYRREPSLYLRARGAELAYWRDPNVAESQSAETDHTGTWEVLFQAATGRHLQIRLVLRGNQRNSPQLRRLRAYYPRFSYVREYLPAAYQNDSDSAGFLERMLANMEGFYTNIEGLIAGAHLLFDPRSAPPETLDWLAAWVGLVLDPLWTKVAQSDRRRLMIRFARRLYEWRGTPEGIRFAVQLLLDPCLEDTLRRLELATVTPNPALRQELESLALPIPTLATREDEIEDLLYRYVLTAPGRGQARLVEAWQTRQGMALQAGDTTRGQADGAETSLAQSIIDAAHRFSVLIPEGLSPETMAMVMKIVDLEKPAHTDYDVRRFWDFFLVGQVRLGLDTVLGEDSRFQPIILGRDYLAEGYLKNAVPMNVPERAVADRDRLGSLRL